MVLVWLVSVSCSWVNPAELLMVPSLLPAEESVLSDCVPSVLPSAVPSVLPSEALSPAAGAAAFREESPEIPKESIAAWIPARESSFTIDPQIL